MSQKEDKLIVRKDTLNLRRKYGRVKHVDVIERDSFVPPGMEEDIKKAIMDKKTILATDLAVQFDIKVSTISDLLEKYEEEGLIELYDPSLKLKIYVPAE